MSRNLLAIYIVLYNSSERLIGLLQSLQHLRALDPEIFIIDNNSDDFHQERYRQMIKDLCDLKRTVYIQNGANIGFARALNPFIKQINASYVMLVNPDVKFDINYAEWLIRGVSSGYADFISGCSVNEKGARDLNIRRYPGIIHNLIGDAFLPRTISTFESYYLDFSCIVIASQIFRRIGLLEEYFLYGEDTNFMMRVRKFPSTLAFTKDDFYSHCRSTSSAGIDKSLKINRIVYANVRNYHMMSLPRNYHARAIVLAAFILSYYFGAFSRLILNRNRVLQMVKIRFMSKVVLQLFRREFYLGDYH